MNTPAETGKRMNLYELLLKEGALGNSSMRSAIAAKILTGEISALVRIHPDTPSNMSTSSLLRNALSDQSKSYQASPLNVPKFRKVLESMAMGNDPDVDALRLIEVVGVTAPAAKIAEKRIPVATQQDTAIIAWLTNNNHNPLKIAVPSKGMAGIKNTCRTACCKDNNTLFSSSKVFNTAWSRLRSNSQIKDAE